MASPFECPVCRNDYNFETKHKAMALSCGHTICQDCISQLVPKDCPTCRALITSQAPNFNLRDAMITAELTRQASPQLGRLLELQIDSISAQLAAKKLEVKTCEEEAVRAAKNVAKNAARNAAETQQQAVIRQRAAEKAQMEAAEAQKEADKAKEEADCTARKVNELQAKAVTVHEDVKLLTAALVSLNRLVGRTDQNLGSNRNTNLCEAFGSSSGSSSRTDKSGKRIILVETNDLQDVLDEMTMCGAPVIYDFQGKDIKYTSEFEAKICTGGTIWRNGKIILPVAHSVGKVSKHVCLAVTGEGVCFESISVIGGGGVQVLDGGSLTMTAFVVKDANYGIRTHGTGSVIANNIKLSNCSANGVHLSGSGSLVATNVQIFNCNGFALHVEDSCMMHVKNLKLTSICVGISMIGNSTGEVSDCVINQAENGFQLSAAAKLVGSQVYITGVRGYVICMRSEAKLALTGCSMTRSEGKSGIVDESASLVLTRCVLDGKIKKKGQATIEINS